MIVLHTLHRHELPVLESVDPIPVVDFVPVPATATSSAQINALRGVIVVNKPSSIPVHSCGRYFANTVQHMLRCGKYSVSSALAEKLVSSIASSSSAQQQTQRSDAETLSTARSLLQSVFGKEGDTGGLHSCHRLDKNTSGCLLFATCPDVSTLVFNALNDKSTEHVVRGGGGEGTEQEEGGSASSVPPPWDQPQDAMCKVYLARVKGRLQPPAECRIAIQNDNGGGGGGGGGGGNPAAGGSSSPFFLVQRSIFCASPKEGVFDCLSPAQEVQAGAYRAEKRRKEAEAEAAAVEARAQQQQKQPAGQKQQKEEKRQRQAEITRGADSRAAVAQAADDAARAAAAVENSKWAATWFRALGYDAGSDETVVECHPATGRTHQLRVHLAALGHPIVGDDVYGYKTNSTPAAAAETAEATAINKRASTVDGCLSWRAEAWTRDFARLAGDSDSSGAATVLDPTPLQAGVDFGFDPICVECNQPRRQHFLDGSAFLALHAWRYRVVLPPNACSEVCSAPPGWARVLADVQNSQNDRF